jgi:hypothetical protein
VLVYERPYIRIYVYELHRLIVTEWIGFAFSDELRSALDEALRLARQNGVTRWVANYQQRRVITPDDQDWVSGVWMPQLSSLGLERLAIVVSENVFSRMSVDTILTRAAGHITWDTRYFDTPKAAEVWALEGGN